MAHDARSVANEIIRRGARQNRVFTHLQVQKLIYYCHAYCLAINGKPLIKQAVSAWQHGPVIEVVYHALKRYGNNQVHPIPRFRGDVYDPDEDAIINSVVEKYGGLSGIALSNMTHRTGSPWHQVVGSNYTRDQTIPDDMIEAYYRAIYEAYLQSLND